MKTPEELAELWVKDRETRLPSELDCQWYQALGDAFLAGYKAAQPKWVSVKERLPEEGLEVLISSKGYGYGVGKIGVLGDWRVGLVDGLLFVDDITHWMTLPEPSEEEK